MAARDITIRIRANTAGLVAGIKSAQMNVASFSKEVEKSAAKKAAVRDLGTEFGKMGLVAAVGVGLAVRAFANFDQAMSNIKALGSDARDNIDALTKSAITWGQKTQYSATEAAAGIAELMKAGVSAKDVLGGGLEGALNLAAAGQIGVADAASTAASAMVQFNLKGKDVPHIADLLAAAANKAQGGVDDMGTALKYVGPIAAQMGVSIEETTGTIAELAQNGVLADQAGTGLRGMLLSLTSPSSTAAKVMADLGINVYDAKGKFVGFQGVAGQLHDRMKDLTAAERDQAFGRIFGNAQITAARILYKGGADDVAKWTAAVDAQGYAAQTAHTKMDNLKGDLEQLRGALETALIGTGEGANAPFRGTIEGLTSVVNLYNKLPGIAKSAVFGIGALTAAFGGSVFVASRALGAYTDIKKNLDLISISSPRAASALRSVGKAAGAIAVAVAAYEALKEASKIGSGDVAPANKFTSALISLAAGSKGAKSELDKLATIKVNKWNILNAGEPGVKGIADAFNSIKTDNVDKFINKLSPYSTKAERAQKIVNQLDTALTSLVTNGHAKTASADIDRLAAITGQSVDKIKGKLPQYTSALRDVANDNDLAAKSSEKLGKSQKTLAEQFGISDKDQKAIVKAANTTAGKFVDMASAVDKAKGSLASFQAELLAQAKALTNFGSNATKALSKGLDEGLVSQLEQLGPAGAKIMADLASATQGEIDKTNRAYEAGGRAIAKYVEATGTIPASLVTQLKVAGAPGAVAQAAKVLSALHQQPDEVRTILKALDYSSKDIKAVLRLMKVLDGTTANPKIHVSSNAAAAAQQAQRDINGVKSSNRYINVMTRDANGSIHEAYGNGGIRHFANGAENHIAQIAPAGAMRMWAEPETGGESYIPLALSKRKRSLDIWAETGRRLGVQGFADGLAAGGFNPLGAASTITKAIDQWVKEITKAKEYDDKHSKISAAADEKAIKALEGLGTKLSTLSDKMSSFSDSVSSHFLNDPFNAGGDTAGGYRSNFDAYKLNVATDTANANAFKAALKIAAKKGLSGDLYGDLAASGDLQSAQGFAAESASQIAKDEKLYAARQRAASSVASQATTVEFGKQLNGLVKELAEVRKRTELGSKTIDALARQLGAAIGHNLSSSAGSAQNRAANTPAGR